MRLTPTVALFLHHCVPKTGGFHLKRDQNIFVQIVVVFMHKLSINYKYKLG